MKEKSGPFYETPCYTIWFTSKSMEKMHNHLYGPYAARHIFIQHAKSNKNTNNMT